MQFSLNAYKYLPGLDETYRLKKDNHWETQLDFTKVNPSEDMLFDSFEAAEAWKNNLTEIVINDKTVDFHKNSEERDLFDKKLDFEIITHRKSKPENVIFTREQLKNVLLAGNDNYNNALVIDHQGYPRLIELAYRSPITITEFPVRFETFGVGNGYVGKHNHFNHLENTYMALLEAWRLHIETGRHFYRDYVSGDKVEEELIQLIHAEVASLA